MSSVWQWAWDRYGARYSWAVFAVTYGVLLPVFGVSAFVVAALEESGHWVETTALAAVATLAVSFATMQPGFKGWRMTQRWAAGDSMDRHRALQSTYTFGRAAIVRGTVAFAVTGGTLGVAVGASAAASASRLVQYGIVGATECAAIQLIAAHAYVEAFFRPVRVAIVAGSGIGDTLPRAVGESNYQEELEAICGGRCKDGANEPVVARLATEPANPYDANAVQVTVEGRLVAYLRRADAALYSPLIADLEREGFIPECVGLIVGGWDRGPNEQGHFGIRLQLGPPDRCCPPLGAEPGEEAGGLMRRLRASLGFDR